jgi:hypothetical protein
MDEGRRRRCSGKGFLLPWSVIVCCLCASASWLCAAAVFAFQIVKSSTHPFNLNNFSQASRIAFLYSREVGWGVCRVQYILYGAYRGLSAYPKKWSIANALPNAQKDHAALRGGPMERPESLFWRSFVPLIARASDRFGSRHSHRGALRPCCRVVPIVACVVRTPTNTNNNQPTSRPPKQTRQSTINSPATLDSYYYSNTVL